MTGGKDVATDRAHHKGLASTVTAATAPRSPVHDPVTAAARLGPPTKKQRDSTTKRHIKLEKEPEIDHAFVDQRLFAARRTKRLDLSIPAARVTKPVIVFQIFPRQVLHQERIGHHLVELWLTNHRLAMLPSEIAIFPLLKVLGLAGNHLTSLPEEIGSITTLERLYLEKNQLRSIPAAVHFPRNLRQLSLDHNGLQAFPLQITELRLLNRLGLSHNLFHVIPPQIRRLTNLVELDLDYNCIGPELPDEMAHLHRLERLGLEGNALETVPICLDLLPHLHYCRLSGNFPRHARSNIEDIGAPVRHDGYFQTREGYLDQKAPHSTQLQGKKAAPGTAPLLTGAIDSREHNLLNREAYCRT
ncbi:TPA: hypothetical protein N0F65_012212 [Lagenidium giganteum]|uniref:Uncharacterized protein n=1 Tax=Lagenidium giganteum TaxID=4803 RepID=A0AAV2ZFQ7_9STRA|nr:TPA: hypothetical protein N0F65_012212 [Lagenidium giganteum]